MTDYLIFFLKKQMYQKCVQNRIDETLEMLESVNCKNLEKPGKKTWKRSLFFSFAAVLHLVLLFLQQKNIWESPAFSVQ